ncbi:MAG: hypothetical protein EXQ47_04420 [Bryobacterales bacterium]|nr:hypothetical protein [Bryobacterales bacterium]
MKTKWMALAIVAGILATGSSLFAQSPFSVGIGIGAPGYYGPPPVVAYRPPYPGPGYSWMDGYYDPYGAWTAGYWAPPAYRYGYAAPRYYAPPRYYGGYSRGYNRGYYGNTFRGNFDYRGRGRDGDRGRR